jgi:hypothetical protein
MSIAKAGRVSEWEHAFIMLAIGAVLAAPVQTMAGPLFQPLLSIADEWAWAVMFLAMGGLRAVALIINGLAPAGSPAVRVLVASFALTTWLFVTAVFLAAAPVGYWAASVYAVLALFEVRIMWSATRDMKGAL